MSEMVERVARAMWGNVSRELWDKLHPRDRADAVNDALRAIAAMREPTVEMEIAGTEYWALKVAMEDRAAGVWRAMIDAALGEG